MDREVVRLTRVLREIAHDAGFAMIYRSSPEAAAFCAGQYNRVVCRLQELHGEAFAALPHLPPEASPARIRMAARDAAWCAALRDLKWKRLQQGRVHPMCSLVWGGMFNLEGS
jgi:hypothetical protein